MPKMKLSETGKSLIKHYEGLRLTAYLCPAGVPSIGYGHTQGVKLGDKITEQQANEFFDLDIPYREQKVFSLLNRQPTQGQFDAMVSLAFNIGTANFARSKVLILFNEGKPQEAAENFKGWRRINGSNGEILQGLVDRREAEKKLFMS